MARRTLTFGVVLLLLLVVALAVALRWRGRQQEEQLLAWLRATVIPLRTVEAGQGFDDLQPLKAVVGDARIVAVGEFSHGSHEIVQLKHRLLEFLVSEMGFTHFCFESSWSAGLPINEYVLHGKGNPRELMRQGVFGVFYSQELLDTLVWMRRHNERRISEKRIQFCGFDIHLTRTTTRWLSEYLQKVDPPFLKEIEPGLQTLAAREVEDIYLSQPRDPQQVAAVETVVPTLVERLAQKRHDYVGRSSEQEWKLAQRHARVLHQATHVFRENSWEQRDFYLAENVEWILQNTQPDTKLVLSAANMHVSFATHRYGIPLGQRLKKRFGRDLVVFGVAFDQGSFRAMDLRKEAPQRGKLIPFSVEPAPRGTWDALFAKVGFPVFVLDLRHAPQPIAQWLRQARPAREARQAVEDAKRTTGSRKVSLPDNYDAIIFIDTSTPVREPVGDLSGQPPGKRADR